MSEARLSPVARFLGEAEASGGPFALLRLTPETCTDETIISALDQQLSRLAAHPQRETPEAEEVVLALHAAAAQLLDPRVRSLLAAHWRGSDGEGPTLSFRRPTAEPAVAPEATSVPHLTEGTRSQAHLVLEQDAIRTIGTFGGWNAEAMRHLTALAHARGLSSDDVVSVVRTMTLRGRPARAAATEPAGTEPRVEASATVSAPEFVQSVSRRDRSAVVFLLVLTGAAVVLTGVLAFAVSQLRRDAPLPVTSGPAADAPIAPAEPGGVAPAPEDAPEAEEPAKARTDRPLDVAAIRREIREASGMAREGDAAAIGRMIAACDSIADQWTSIGEDELIALHQDVIEFLYRASARRETGDEAVRAIARHLRPLSEGGAVRTDEVLPAAWAAGMLNRLLGEEELPATMRNEMARSLTEALGEQRPVYVTTFRAGADAALSAMMDRLEVDTAAWEVWADATEHLGGKDAPGTSRRLLLGLESVLTGRDDPSESQRAYDVVRQLVRRLSWREGAEARTWLLRWFTDARLTAGDLHAVTSTLATESSAPGVDVTMVLPVSAAMRARIELRDRYAAAWSLAESEAATAAAAEWAEAARDAIDAFDPAQPMIVLLADAVRFARLNEVGLRLWLGTHDEAARLLDHVDADLEWIAGTSAGGFEEGAGPSDWSIMYLQSRRNIPVRLDLLEEARRQTLDTVAAEVIVSEAVRGTPSDVRRAATEVVIVHASNPAIVNGLLEILPMAPRSTALSELIEAVTYVRLPPTTHASWAVAARRALVEQLLSLIAASGEWGEVERLAGRLGETYTRMTADRPGMAPPSSNETAEVAAGLVWRRLRQSVGEAAAMEQPVSLPEIERRRGARLKLASGRVQAFAAHQASICELLAYVVAGERPADGGEVVRAMDELAETRRGASSILEQIAVTEATMTRLWLIRLGLGEGAHGL